MTRLTKVNEELFIAEDAISSIGANELSLIRDQVLRSPRRRARICVHPHNDDAVHEMIIAIDRNSYIRPHKHVGKSESFHVIEGEVDVIVLNDDGEICDLVELGAIETGKKFMYRMSESFYHTLAIHSDLLLVHEVTAGPFKAEMTTQAPFAPAEGDQSGIVHYLDALRHAVRNWKIKCK